MDMQTHPRRSNEGSLPHGMIPPEPMPANIRSIQPGGGVIQAVELAWGSLRRRILKSLFPRYVQHRKSRLQGDVNDCPVEVIDSRDLKFFKNVAGCWFDPADDNFAWRDRLPFARAGLAELLVFGGPLVVLAILFIWPIGWPWLSVPPLLGAAFVAYFFRDPNRNIPTEPGVVVSPADGKIVDVTPLDSDGFVHGPAVKIGIFLSVFNVHVNRAALAGRVHRLSYHPGRFLNALSTRSAEVNERLEIACIEEEFPHRRFVIKQIAGLIARRIVCEVRPGQAIARGERIGMIKFGSRTELIVPAAGLEVLVRVGTAVKGGSTILGRYQAENP